MICPICSSNSVSHQSRYRFNHSCFENLNRVACKNCGLQFSNPMPNEQNLISYNNSYHLSAHGGFKRTTKQNAFDKKIVTIYRGWSKKIVTKYAFDKKIVTKYAFDKRLVLRRRMTMYIPSCPATKSINIYI